MSQFHPVVDAAMPGRNDTQDTRGRLMIYILRNGGKSTAEDEKRERGALDGLCNRCGQLEMDTEINTELNTEIDNFTFVYWLFREK